MEVAGVLDDLRRRGFDVTRIGELGFEGFEISLFFALKSLESVPASGDLLRSSLDPGRDGSIEEEPIPLLYLLDLAGPGQAFDEVGMSVEFGTADEDGGFG